MIFFFFCRGDRAFCTVECRCKQIFMDEESVMKDNCSVAATASRHRKGNRNRAGGMFAYWQEDPGILNIITMLPFMLLMSNENRKKKRKSPWLQGNLCSAGMREGFQMRMFWSFCFYRGRTNSERCFDVDSVVVTAVLCFKNKKKFISSSFCVFVSDICRTQILLFLSYTFIQWCFYKRWKILLRYVKILVFNVEFFFM